jgi:hypothetical protein
LEVFFFFEEQARWDGIVSALFLKCVLLAYIQTPSPSTPLWHAWFFVCFGSGMTTGRAMKLAPSLTWGDPILPGFYELLMEVVLSLLEAIVENSHWAKGL